MISHVARSLDLHPNTVSKWTKVPAEYVFSVSNISRIKPEVLRPDLFVKDPLRQHLVTAEMLAGVDGSSPYGQNHGQKRYKRKKPPQLDAREAEVVSVVPTREETTHLSTETSTGAMPSMPNLVAP